MERLRNIEHETHTGTRFIISSKHLGFRAWAPNLKVIVSEKIYREEKAEAKGQTL